MKIDNSRPVGRVSSPSKASSAAKPAASSGNVRQISDGGAILGIPETELTPKVREAIMSLMAEVDHLRRELDNNRRRLLELEELADLDALLPILNRRAFMRELTRILSFAERYQVHAAMIYFDLDHFKEVNDEYGHAAGDAILKHVAETLQKNIRTSDALGRLGGDEFGVILAQANADQAMQKAQSLVTAMTRVPVKWEGHKLPIHISHGVYSFEKGADPVAVLAEADRAMYEKKAARKKG